MNVSGCNYTCVSNLICMVRCYVTFKRNITPTKNQHAILKYIKNIQNTIMPLYIYKLYEMCA